MDGLSHPVVFAGEPSSFFYMLVFFCYILLMRPPRRYFTEHAAPRIVPVAPRPLTAEAMLDRMRIATATLRLLSDELGLLVLTTRAAIASHPQVNTHDPLMQRLLLLTDEVHLEILDTFALLDQQRYQIQCRISGGCQGQIPTIATGVHHKITGLVERCDKTVDLVQVVCKLHRTRGGTVGIAKIRSELNKLLRLVDATPASGQTAAT